MIMDIHIGVCGNIYHGNENGMMEFSACGDSFGENNVSDVWLDLRSDESDHCYSFARNDKPASQEYNLAVV